MDKMNREERSEEIMDKIVMSGFIKSVLTNWAKEQIRITIETSVDEAEYERETLGKLARAETTVDVFIHDKDRSIHEALEVVCTIESVRTDNKMGTVATVISAYTTDENIGKAGAFGNMCIRSTAITAHFQPREVQMDMDSVIRTTVKKFNELNPDGHAVASVVGGDEEDE